MLAIASLTVVAAVGGVLYLRSSNVTAPAEKAEARHLLSRSKKGATKVKSAKSETRIRTAKNEKGGDWMSMSAKASETAKKLDEMLEKEVGGLSVEYQNLIRDLRQALEDDNKKRIRKTVQGLLAAYQSGVKIPTVVLESMAFAAAGCGVDALPEMVGLLAGKDPAVADVASDAFEEMLMNADGDHELAEVLVTVLPYLKDTELISGAMAELGHMRNSVRVETALAIFESGNESAIQVLQENLSTYFSDQEGAPEVKTYEDVVAYGKANPDGADDEAFYGKWMNQENDE